MERITKKSKTRNVVTASINMEVSGTTPISLEIDEDDYKTVNELLQIYRESGYQAGYNSQELEENERYEEDHRIMIGYRSHLWRCGIPDRCISIKEDDKARRVSEIVWWAGKPPSEPTYLPAFPNQIGKLTALEVLGLNFCDMKTLPCTIGNLINLRELHLKYTWKLSCLPVEIGNLTNLRVLKISESPLAVLPSSIGKLSNMEELELLGMDNLQHIPDEVRGLVNLKVLRLGNTPKISRIPDGIGGLTNLQIFSCRGTNIFNIPDSIGNLSNLEMLHLHVAKFNRLPDTIGRMAGLEIILLFRSQIVSLPESIGDLANLKQLDLSCSKVASLPNSIGNLVNLKQLHLKKSDIVALPGSIGNLVNLKLLDLSWCKISSLPNSIGNLKNLKTLSLRSTTELKTLPDEIQNLTSLEILSLSMSGVVTHTIPDVIKSLKNLQVMFLDESFLEGDLVREKSLMNTLEHCQRLGCIGQHIGCFGLCCENPACFAQFHRFYPHPGPRYRDDFVCHKKLTRHYGALISSLVRNKARSRILFPRNSANLSFPPQSLWPLILAKVEHAGDFECYRGHYKCRGSSNLLPQADGIFHLFVDYGDRILVHAEKRRQV